MRPTIDRPVRATRARRWLSSALLGAALAAASSGGIARPVSGAPNPTATIRTSLGKIRLELYPEAAPVTVENFKKYVRGGFYDGTIFHRVIDGFMIQGGGFTPEMKEKTPTYLPIVLESKNGLDNLAGTVAMARKGEPNSATCQFFINVVDNPNLDYNPNNPRDNGYAVFGRVIEGMDVIGRIKAAETGTRGIHRDVPVQPILIEAVVLD